MSVSQLDGEAGFPQDGRDQHDGRFQHVVAVDIGNSRMHLGIFRLPLASGWPLVSAVKQLATGTCQAELALLDAWLPHEPLAWYVASVHRQAERHLAAWVQTHRSDSRYHVLNFRDLPLNVQVDFPERVGVDRLVGAVAANHLRMPQRSAIVVDAGSAVTVDLVGPDGTFLGGAILPGVAMWARSLAEGTDLLPTLTPDLSSDQPPAAVGKSTEAAIHSGLFWGAVGAVRELIQRISSQSEQVPQVFVTGGYAHNMASLLDPSTQAVPNLLLGGIALVSQQLHPHRP